MQVILELCDIYDMQCLRNCDPNNCNLDPKVHYMVLMEVLIQVHIKNLVK
jgi:hypothetical protein